MKHIQFHSLTLRNILLLKYQSIFINKKQSLMDLYKLHTVHVPLDKDTYDGKESKYTQTPS